MACLETSFPAKILSTLKTTKSLGYESKAWYIWYPGSSHPNGWWGRSSTNCPSSLFSDLKTSPTFLGPRSVLGEMSHIGDSIESQVHGQECLRSQSLDQLVVSRLPHWTKKGCDCDFMWIYLEVKCLMPSTLIIRNLSGGQMSGLVHLGTTGRFHFTVIKHGKTKSPLVENPKSPKVSLNEVALM